MSIAISDDHVALADSVSKFLAKRAARASGRALLEAGDERLPEFWVELRSLGWLGLHLPEEYGGAGYSIEELVVVVEELGAAIAPGPFVPTVVASAFISAATDEATKARLLPGLADGTTTAAVCTEASLTLDDAEVSGSPVVLGGGFADVLVLAAGADVAIVETGKGVTVRIPENLDPTRRTARITFERTPVIVVPGAAKVLLDLERVILSAEAVGIAAEATRMAAAYAKSRIQFGRPIATFQAVKHHCANMAVAVEMSASAVWDAARAASAGGDQLSYTAAVAATLAGPAVDFCANHMTQVYGGIAITWEHDAHLFMRRATVLQHLLAPKRAAADLVDLTRSGVERAKIVELPPEAEALRPHLREFVSSIKDLPPDSQRTKLIETGYVMPHWPKPFGRDASAVEQLVIEQEFAAGGRTSALRNYRVEHSHDHSVRHARATRSLGPAGPRPGGGVVPTVQRAGRGLRRRRCQDSCDPRRRRLAGQRSESVDVGRTYCADGLRHSAYQPECAQTSGYYDDGDRYARRRCSGPAAENDDR